MSEIVLCGGPDDGLRITPPPAHEPYIRAATANTFNPYASEVIYTPMKYVSGWPIETWDFFVDYDVTLHAKGNEGEAYMPWWTKRVWATRQRHLEIELAFTDLYDAAKVARRNPERASKCALVVCKLTHTLLELVHA